MRLLQRGKSIASKGALALIGGTVIAQIITLVATPILTRIYPPEAFGFLSLILAASSIVAPAIGLRLESALLLPRSRETATALFSISLISSFILALVTGLTMQLIFASGAFKTLASLPGFPWWAAAVSFFTAFFSLAGQFALRSQMYGAVSRRTVYQSLATAVGQLSMALVSRTGTGLVAGHLFGRIIGIAPLIVSSKNEFSRFGFSSAKFALVKYWRFPVIFTPSVVLNSAGLAIPILFVGTWYSVEDAGQWGIADRMLAIPLVLVGSAVGQVVEAEFAIRIRNSEGNLRALFYRSTAILSVFAIAFSLAVYFLSPLVVPAYLGPDWGIATELMQVLVFSMAARLVAGPLSKVLVVLQFALLNLFLDLLRVAAVSGAMVAVIVMDLDIVNAGICVAASMTSIYVVTWGVSLLALQRYESKLDIPVV